MKVVAISSTHEVKRLVQQSQDQGYLTFVYHHADPMHEALTDPFLYIHKDEELREKLHLLKMDVSAVDLIRR